MPAASKPRAASSRRKRSLDADFELEVPGKSSRRAAEAGIRRRQTTSREMEEAADAAAEEEEAALLRSMGQRSSQGSGGELLSCWRLGAVPRAVAGCQHCCAVWGII